jgi:hypothetical protein
VTLPPPTQALSTQGATFVPSVLGDLNVDYWSTNKNDEKVAPSLQHPILPTKLKDVPPHPQLLKF